MLLIILVVFLVLSVGGGFASHREGYYVGWSPLGLITLILLILWLAGRLHC
jgi:hypothetical protein